MNIRKLTVWFIAVVGAALLTVDLSASQEKLKPQTVEDLKAAMQETAFTYFKYTAFAELARKEGKVALAEVLEQTAKDERSHFHQMA
jgi:hypothetical protein